LTVDDIKTVMGMTEEEKEEYNKEGAAIQEQGEGVADKLEQVRRPALQDNARVRGVVPRGASLACSAGKVAFGRVGQLHAVVCLSLGCL